ncbi:MAG: hypothetical protein ABIQ04_03340 [Candidatus Saccharimonadales bacterium]
MKLVPLKKKFHHTKPSSRIGLFLSHHKKISIALGGALFVCLIAGSYIWWSFSAWAQFEDRYVSLRQNTATKFSDTLKLPVGTADQKIKKIAAFDELGKDITGQQNICEDVPGLIKWQHTVSAIKRYEDDCKSLLVKLGVLKTNITEMTGYIKDEQAVATLIQTASTGSLAELDETTMQDTAAKWHTFSEKMKVLKVTTEFEPVLIDLRTKSDHLDACWQEVIAAHTAKDRARFEKARDELSRAYGSFKDSRQVSDKVSAEVQKTLEAQYAQNKS